MQLYFVLYDKGEKSIYKWYENEIKFSSSRDYCSNDKSYQICIVDIVPRAGTKPIK